MISGCRPVTPDSSTARSPASRIIFSTSSWALATLSSIRPGWMRPSMMRLVSARRAISRRTGSKADRTTASGVSSMMTSTPVRVSKARMLRPSRPMMRPLTSSEGRATTETVLSLTWSVAMRWKARVRMPRARLSPVGLGLLLDLMHQAGGVHARLVLDVLEEQGAGLVAGQVGEALQGRLLLLLQVPDLLKVVLGGALLDGEGLPLVVQAGQFSRPGRLLFVPVFALTVAVRRVFPSFPVRHRRAAGGPRRGLRAGVPCGAFPFPWRVALARHRSRRLFVAADCRCG